MGGRDQADRDLAVFHQRDAANRSTRRRTSGIEWAGATGTSPSSASR